MIINEEQRALLSKILFDNYFPISVSLEIEKTGLREVILKGDDFENRMAFKKAEIESDVLSVLEGGYYSDIVKGQNKTLIDEAVAKTVDFIFNSYDYSGYNEDIDCLLTSNIHDLIRLDCESGV